MPKVPTKIVWEDPPAPVGGGRGVDGIWFERLDFLFVHPLRWARVHECPNRDAAMSTARNLRLGLVQVPDKFEFVARNQFIYARYLGPKKTGKGK